MVALGNQLSGQRAGTVRQIQQDPQLTTTERENEAAYQRLFSQFTLALQSLKEKGHYQWILLDLPHGAGTCRHRAADPAGSTDNGLFL